MISAFSQQWEEIKKFLELNENQNTTFRKQMFAVKGLQFLF
jgi:hypothetical protein